MSTVEIDYNNIWEFREDLKRMKIRHGPFRRQGRLYIVEIYNTSKISYLRLKYSGN